MQERNDYDFDMAEDRLTLAGFDTDMLVDPADASADELREGGWLLVCVRSGEINRYAVEERDVMPPEGGNDAFAEAEVAFGRGAAQPVGFDGPLNDEPINMAERTKPRVAYFSPPDGYRGEQMLLSKRQAIRALSTFKSEAQVPGPAADAIAAPFACPIGIWRNVDPDVPGGAMYRAPSLAKGIAAEELGHAIEAESDISGHKKRRRQVFNRNLGVLRDALEMDD